MLSAPQWFLKVSEIREKLLSMNEGVTWSPKWMKDRMRNWLENLYDWPVSRKRYWGAPLPIWVCVKCGKRKVIGSIKELGKEVPSLPKEFDLHKPFIDSVKLKCSCGGEMNRVEEVLDVWFDSGVSSWAALDYPQREDLLKRFWPADLNIEAAEQVRGWWNSQLILSEILFDKTPFKQVTAHGFILGMGKVKMSKSLGNIVQPGEVIQKYNRDYLRWYYAFESRGEDIQFEPVPFWNYFKDVERFFNTLLNAFNYAGMYSTITVLDSMNLNEKDLKAEDKWILSKLNSLIKEAKRNYAATEYFKVVQLLEGFVLEDLSRTYIKSVKDRVGSEESKSAEKVITHSLYALLGLLAPICPHITEYFYQGIKEKGMPESIHLTRMPEANEKLIDESLEAQLGTAKQLAEKVLALRESKKLKLRWQLKSLLVANEKEDPLPDFKELLARMVNVKLVKWIREKPSGKFASSALDDTSVFLDLETKGLEEEWELQELRRRLQDERKKAGLLPSQKVNIMIATDDKAFIEKFRNALEEATNSGISVQEKPSGELEKLLKRSFSIQLKT
jgi:isoleucyl-tRNA synthetase